MRLAGVDQPQHIVQRLDVVTCSHPGIAVLFLLGELGLGVGKFPGYFVARRKIDTRQLHALGDGIQRFASNRRGLGQGEGNGIAQLVAGGLGLVEPSGHRIAVDVGAAALDEDRHYVRAELAANPFGGVARVIGAHQRARPMNDHRVRRVAVQHSRQTAVLAIRAQHVRPRHDGPVFVGGHVHVSVVANDSPVEAHLHRRPPRPQLHRSDRLSRLLHNPRQGRPQVIPPVSQQVDVLLVDARHPRRRERGVVRVAKLQQQEVHACFLADQGAQLVSQLPPQAYQVDPEDRRLALAVVQHEGPGH